MAAWRIGDATLRSGGRVEGMGPIAERLRRIVATGPDVQVLPVPMAKEPWTPGSDFILDCFARDEAYQLAVECMTEYEPDERDAPPDLRRRLEQWPRDAKEVFVGTVH